MKRWPVLVPVAVWTAVAVVVLGGFYGTVFLVLKPERVLDQIGQSPVASIAQTPPERPPEPATSLVPPVPSPPTSSLGSELRAAEDAAETWVTSTGAILEEGPLRRRDLILSMCTPDAGERMADRVSVAVSEMTSELSAMGYSLFDLSWDETVFLVAGRMVGPDTAEVEVESLITVSLEGGATAMLSRTAMVRTRLIDGVWLIEDETNEVESLISGQLDDLDPAGVDPFDPSDDRGEHGATPAGSW